LECSIVATHQDIPIPISSLARDAEAARVAAPVDPVFAAIERHRAAWAEFAETVGPLESVEGEQEGSKEDLAYRAANAAADEAFEEFLATPPTTLAGLRAALEYVVEVDSGCLPDNGGRIAETFLRSPLFAGMNGEDRTNV
jgi:hypothetical protein